MNFPIFVLVILSELSLYFCDVSHIVKNSYQDQEPERPYAFGYAAGRYPGHIDRTHSEISDGGTVHGSYSYVDPNYRIRTVNYVADKNGFRPTLNIGSEDTLAVANAKQKHLNDYNAIAYAHQSGNVIVPGQTQAYQRVAEKHNELYQKIAEEHARIAAERASEVSGYTVKY